MKIGIQDIAVYIPAGRRSNQELIEQHGFEQQFLETKLGIESRSVAAADEYASDLAIRATESLFSAAGLSPDQVELLIVVSQTPDYVLPHISALVHGSLGLPKTCMAFDISLGCSGYVYGLATACALMEAQGLRNGILVTADTYSKLLAPNDRSTTALFGDAATATLLTDQPIYQLGACTFGSDGGRHASLIARGSALRREISEPLFMDGRAIFEFALTEIPRDVRVCLQKNQVGADEIDAWIFHQANQFMLETLAARLQVPRDKLVIDYRDVGNTTSSSIPLAFQRHLLQQDLRPGKVLLCGFGVGLSWASTVLTYSGSH